MKKGLKLFVILLTIIFSTLSLPSRTLFRTVKAKYVEGAITQDTVWTLVDSPFIVSNDITVDPDATLTIEPGVDVRFGGAFSLTVLGRLYANGTEKAIEFTSNKEQPNAGDWDAINFRGTEKSTLIGCFVAYATVGIILENSNVEIQNTNVSLCSQDGIKVLNGKLTVQASTIGYCSQNGINSTYGELTVRDNVIVDNGGTGIVITGDKQVTIQENTIIGNGKGILLTGNETSKVDITQNIISANEQNGIEINAESHTNLEILHNNVSSNQRGFYISTSTSTHISNNSISYNEIGILYDQGNHTAHFNDIYGNELGMDVASDAKVSAEHNYWGHESGPYHETLNPDGQGNPIGGDGVNPDFIFFLTKSFGHVNERPNATLLIDKALVPRNLTVMFFATNSFDEGRVDRYFFDFGDGNTSGWTTLSVVTHKYLSLGAYNASLIVMDDFGATSNNVTVTINVQDLPPLDVEIDVDNHVVYEGEEIQIAVYVTDGTTAVDNADLKLFSLPDGNLSDSMGYSNSTGHFVTTFTAPDVTYRTYVRVVVTASKGGYADGSSCEDLESLPSLSVEVVADPNTVKSEGETQVTVYVRSNEQPVAGALVSASSDSGELSTATEITDFEGSVLLGFTAPQTTHFLNANVTATATRSGYMEGVGKTVITVEPKVLVVNLTAEPIVTISDAVVNASVHVEYDMIPVSGANVTLTVASKSFSGTALTDISGDVTFTFVAPLVNESSSLNIVARASKEGYADGNDSLAITVNPRTFNIQVEVTPLTIESEETATVTVHVTCKEDEAPVAGGAVTVSASGGNFLIITNTTDSKGSCTFVFNAPYTTVQLPVTVAANVTKNGYVEGGNQTTITVTPKTAAGGGWPITTILLVLIPIVIGVIVLVLTRLGIITFSTKEEGEE